MSGHQTKHVTIVQPAATTAEPDLLDQIVQRMSEVVHRAAPQVQPMELRTFEELERWAERAARSKMVPAAYHGKPDDIVLAVQMGSELGLRPMQSLQNIAIINGKPSVYGDAMLALCMTHPLYRSVQESVEGEGDNRVSVCVVHRQGDAPKVVRFGVADAKRAGLWSKQGPWTQYPDRMLQMRARGFALRDAFPDKLRGLVSAEEAGDYTLEAAGISAAPPVPDEAPNTPPQTRDSINAEFPMSAPQDKAALAAEALEARFAAVVTAQDYYAILDEERTAAQMKWLREKRADLFTRVDAVRRAASERMQDAPVDEAPAAAADDELPL